MTSGTTLLAPPPASSVQFPVLYLSRGSQTLNSPRNQTRATKPAVQERGCWYLVVQFRSAPGFQVLQRSGTRTARLDFEAEGLEHGAEHRDVPQIVIDRQDQPALAWPQRNMQRENHTARQPKQASKLTN
eukprot:497632-Rhodomonas_salina.2